MISYRQHDMACMVKPHLAGKSRFDIVGYYGCHCRCYRQSGSMVRPACDVQRASHNPPRTIGIGLAGLEQSGFSSARIVLGGLNLSVPAQAWCPPHIGHRCLRWMDCRDDRFDLISHLHVSASRFRGMSFKRLQAKNPPDLGAGYFGDHADLILVAGARNPLCRTCVLRIE